MQLGSANGCQSHDPVTHCGLKSLIDLLPTCRRTEEGYAIYNEEELGFNKKGGDTDLCPFDCDCCFVSGQSHRCELKCHGKKAKN